MKTELISCLVDIAKYGDVCEHFTKSIYNLCLTTKSSSEFLQNFHRKKENSECSWCGLVCTNCIKKNILRCNKCICINCGFSSNETNMVPMFKKQCYDCALNLYKDDLWDYIDNKIINNKSYYYFNSRKYICIYCGTQDCNFYYNNNPTCEKCIRYMNCETITGKGFELFKCIILYKMYECDEEIMLEEYSPHIYNRTTKKWKDYDKETHISKFDFDGDELIGPIGPVGDSGLISLVGYKITENISSLPNSMKKTNSYYYYSNNHYSKYKKNNRKQSRIYQK